MNFRELLKSKHTRKIRVFFNNLEQLTEKIIEYLASRSAFAAVEACSKLSVTWSEIKK